MKRKKKGKNDNIIAFIGTLIIILILLIIIFLVKTSTNEIRIYSTDISNAVNNIIDDINNIKEPPKELEIFSGDDRLIAVMIDNEYPAWPHSGLADAYMIYEVIIEGGESRMMALFKNSNAEKIGPIRSSRHYFVHYALEHNAVYCHFGWSPLAEETIKDYGVNNINGLYDDYYWRVGGGYHNAFSSIENISDYMDRKDYSSVGKTEPLYNYSYTEYDLDDGTDVSNLRITYSTLHNVSYEYDEENKVFLRSMRDIEDVDRETKKRYFAKNIIIMYAENYTLNDGSGKGRQELVNITDGTGHYLTNGKKIDITWKKDSKTSKTYFYNDDNEEITLNDGITYVQIVPIDNTVDFN